MPVPQPPISGAGPNGSDLRFGQEEYARALQGDNTPRPPKSYGPLAVARGLGLNVPSQEDVVNALMGAARFVGPQADVLGMKEDAARVGPALEQGNYLDALSSMLMAGAAVPMMAMPGTVSQVKGVGKKITDYPIASKDEWYGDANFESTGGKMVNMSPDEYLKKVRKLDIDEVSRDNIDDLKAHIESGRTLDPLAIYGKNKIGALEDGRHRAHAAKELGIESVPVLIFDE